MFNYDEVYYTNMYKIYMPTARDIMLRRWNFVSAANPEVVLDYGCGCNFFALYAPKNLVIDTYDIGHFDGVLYPQTGIQHSEYDLITFWDVLEHVDWKDKPDYKILNIMQLARWVAITVPVKPDDKPIETWKHYKPGEHLTYFTSESMAEFMGKQGLDQHSDGYIECPPRTDILSMLFKRRL